MNSARQCHNSLARLILPKYNKIHFYRLFNHKEQITLIRMLSAAIMIIIVETSTFPQHKDEIWITMSRYNYRLLMDIAHHRTIYDMPLTIMAMCSSLSMFYCFHYNSNVKNLIHRRVHRLHWSLQVLQQTFSRMFNNKCKQNRCT